MTLKKIAVIVLMMNLALLSVSFAGTRKQGEMPAPRLIMPGDEAVLTDKNQLEFRWGNESGGSFDHYDFTIYKGTQPYEPYIIFKKEIPAGVSSFLVDGALFKAGESYSWSLRYAGLKKSQKAYSIFKIKA